MALRIGEHVIAGTIDNSVRGRITGALQIEGIDGPVTLDLQGNAHPDMAGCVLRFSNTHSSAIDADTAERLRMEQQGHAGDVSGSQKRKVPKGFPNVPADFSFDPSDFVLTNILYLEWFDHYNGRVVIEGVGYEWQIDLPRWQLSDEEVSEQAQQTEDAANLFMNLAMEQYDDDLDELREEERTEIDPLADDEFAWEKRLKKSDQRVDALMKLLDQAKNDEERRTLLKQALASGMESDVVDLFDPDAETIPWDDEEDNGTSPFREIDPATHELAIQVSDWTGRLLSGGLAKSIAVDGDLLAFAVKTQATVDQILKDGHTPFDLPDARPIVDPGHMIARFKREIARAEKLNSISRDEGSPEPVQEALLIVRKIRDLLVSLVGCLRKLG